MISHFEFFEHCGTGRGKTKDNITGIINILYIITKQNAYRLLFSREKVFTYFFQLTQQQPVVQCVLLVSRLKNILNVSYSSEFFDL